jgi:hypothetical protein
MRIFNHADEAGTNAYRRWQAQLDGIAAKVDGFDFSELTQTDGQPVKDLNDALRIDYDCLEINEATIEAIMDF